jgi:hypothetical protein
MTIQANTTKSIATLQKLMPDYDQSLLLIANECGLELAAIWYHHHTAITKSKSCTCHSKAFMTSTINGADLFKERRDTFWRDPKIGMRITSPTHINLPIVSIGEIGTETNQNQTIESDHQKSDR